MRFDLWQGDLDPIELVLDGVGPIQAGSVATFIAAQANGTKRIEASAVITDFAKRAVTYAFQPGDTDTPGVYRAVMKLLDPNGHPETYPSDEPLFIVIRPAL